MNKEKFEVGDLVFAYQRTPKKIVRCRVVLRRDSPFEHTPNVYKLEIEEDGKYIPYEYDDKNIFEEYLLFSTWQGSKQAAIDNHTRKIADAKKSIENSENYIVKLVNNIADQRELLGLIDEQIAEIETLEWQQD